MNESPRAPGEVRRADFAASKELAKEIGRLLNGFVPPGEGYRPEPPLPPGRIEPEAGRDLGAASLADFFSLALEGEVEEEMGRLPPHFPKGPETIRQATAAVEVEINRLVQAGIKLEKNWPPGRFGLEAALRPLEDRRADLAAGLADLSRADRLWARLKEESDLWLDEARAMWRKAKRLTESQDLVLKTGSNGESGWLASPQADLTGAVKNLRAEVGPARALALKGEDWAQKAEALTAEFDDLLALALDDSEPDRDWEAIERRLAGRIRDLSQAGRELDLAEPGTAGALEAAARSLAEAEKKLTGARGLETLTRLESLGRGGAALWRSVVDIRREMARLYFFLPERLGRPRYLEKNFLSAARLLGRTQALLEDLRHRLSLAGGRLSSSQKLKAESAELLERLRPPADRSAVLDKARSRLKKLAAAKARPAAAPFTERQTLSFAQLEKESLSEQLAETRRALNNAALTKARLLKVFGLKTEFLKTADQERSRLAEETEGLRRQREELSRRHGDLTAVLAQARGRVQTLRTALEQFQDGDLRALMAEREEAVAQLAELRREKSQLETDRRALQDALRRKAAEEAETGAGMEALAAELNRHKEELAAVSRSRQSLGEIVSALRRRLDLLVQAHRSLKMSLAKKSQGLARTEAEKDLLNNVLTRQKRNLLRLATARQELRAELGAVRLKLDDLEEGRKGLLDQLEEAKRLAGAADSEKKLLEERLAGEKERLADELEEAKRLAGAADSEKKLLEERLAGQLAELKTGVSENLLPFIAVLGEALWRGEAMFNRAREDHDLTLTRIKQESEVREGNIRLTGAARELELAEAAQAERGQWAEALARREEELGQAAAAAQAEREHWERSREEELEEVARAERERWAGVISGREAELARSAADLEAARAEREQWAESLSRRDEELGQAAEAAARAEGERWAEVLSRREAELAQILSRREEELSQALAQREEELSQALTRREEELSQALTRREYELIQTNQAERGQWTLALKQRESQLAQAQERLRSLSESPDPGSALFRDQEGVIAQLNLRSQKMARAIGLMKRRYDRRLAEAGQMESELRRDLQRRTLEMQESREHLAELEPLLDHFFQTAEQSLAPGDANLELVRYLREENRRLEDGDRESIGGLSSALKARLAGFQPLVDFLARSFVAGLAELAQARREREAWESSQAELEARLSDQAGQVAALKGELAQADRDLAENDGRLEAVWAGMNYLGARASDRLGEMQNRLENQTRQVDGLAAELGRRDARIRELEERQDQLSLLYWTLVAQAQAQAGAQEADSAADSLDIPDPAPADSAPPALDQARNSGGFNLGRQLLEGAKKVARRSLFSLILAGSLVLSGARADGAIKAPEQDRLPAASPPALATRFESSYVGRPVGLEQVDSSPRLAGRQAVEERLAALVGELSAAQGLTEGEFLRLVRAARGPEATVHLGDFSGREGALALLQAHFPKLAQHIAVWPPEIPGPGPLAALLKNAAGLRAAEGGFWERLFFDLWAERADQGAAFTRLLGLMADRAPASPRLEFAGRLAPFSPLENLGHDRFVDFMSAHLKTAWAGAGGRPRELAARRLAGDLFFNARFFQLPLTLFAVLIQQEAEEGLTGDLYRRGAALALHHRAIHLARQTRRAAVAWEAGRPHLCDLDRALGEKDSFIESVYRKKLALVQACNRYLSAGDSLLAALP